MRRVICGEKWLPLNPITLASVGFPLHRMALMGVAFGDIYPKVERFFPNFSFEVGDGPTIFCWHDHW